MGVGSLLQSEHFVDVGTDAAGVAQANQVGHPLAEQVRGRPEVTSDEAACLVDKGAQRPSGWVFRISAAQSVVR